MNRQKLAVIAMLTDYKIKRIREKDKNASSALIQTERSDLDVGYIVSTHEG